MMIRLALSAVAATLLLSTEVVSTSSVHGDWISVHPGTATTCNVLDYGAVGDGITDDTLGVQKALTACASGGTTLLPLNYIFLVFALVVNNPTNFVVSIQGTLLFNNNTKKWSKNTSFCFTMNGGNNVGLTGGGLVDGNGLAWWPNYDGFRPGLVKAESVTNLLIHNLTFQNSPNHQLELYAGPMEIVDTTILASLPCQNPNGSSLTTTETTTSPLSYNGPKPLCSHNTDGIDVHGSPAWLHRLYISTGDDNIAMHANDTLVEDCFFGYGHGVSIGSLGVGTYLKNITVSNSTFVNTEQAVRIKGDYGATGYLNDVTYTNLNMSNIGDGGTVILTMFYGTQSNATTTLKISNITISNIVSENAEVCGVFQCAASSPCEGLIVSNVTHTGSSKPKDWQCENVFGTVTDVTPPLCISS